MTQALRDMRHQGVVLTVLAASGVAWFVLLAALPAAQTFVCGADGYGPVGGAWNAGRLVSLVCMWLVMAPAMMLPGATFVCLFSPRGEEARRADEGALRIGFPLIASLRSALLPAGEKREQAPPFSFLLGDLGVVGGVSLIAALSQWILESTGAIGEGGRIANPVLAGLVLAGIGAWHVGMFLHSKQAPCGSDSTAGGSVRMQGWRHGCSSLGCCLTMVGLQFVGGAMNVGLMISLTLWVLLETALPWKRHIAAATGIALLTAGGLTIAGAIA